MYELIKNSYIIFLLYIIIKFDIAISSVKSFANNYNNNVGGMIYVQFNDNRKKSERIR